MIHHKKLYISQIDINSWFLSVFESSEVKTANFVAMLVSFHPWCLCGDVSWSWLTNKCNGRLWWHQWHWWTVLTDHSNDDTVWLSAQRFFDWNKYFLLPTYSHVLFKLPFNLLFHNLLHKNYFYFSLSNWAQWYSYHSKYGNNSHQSSLCKFKRYIHLSFINSKFHDDFS